MSEIHPLDLKLAPDVKDAMRVFISRIIDMDAMVVLIKNALDGAWVFGAYRRAELEQLERRGTPYLYAVDGLILAIPQPVDMSELHGKTFYLCNRKLLLADERKDI
jgi:hypothetical protein